MLDKQTTFSLALTKLKYVFVGVPASVVVVNIVVFLVVVNNVIVIIVVVVVGVNVSVDVVNVFVRMLRGMMMV